MKKKDSIRILSKSIIGDSLVRKRELEKLIRLVREDERSKSPLVRVSNLPAPRPAGVRK